MITNGLGEKKGWCIRCLPEQFLSISLVITLLQNDNRLAVSLLLPSGIEQLVFCTLIELFCKFAL
jgi:hypothetical protein